MEYQTIELDRTTGELVEIPLGDWLTISEVGERHGVGRKRVRRILYHMGLMQPERHRYRLAAFAIERGFGRRLVNPKTGGGFDVISPEGQELISRAWDDTAADLGEEERRTPMVRDADAALSAFVDFRSDGLDTEGQVRWLLDHFPLLIPTQIAEIIGCHRTLVERYAHRRASQLAVLTARKVAHELSELPPALAAAA